jgi:hypothetical protein
MTGKKISDDELLKIVEKKDKTEKEVAYSNGYSYPSASLNSRIRELGFTGNQKINVKSSNAGQFYLGKEPMQLMAEQKGIDLQETGKVFFRQVGTIEDGCITLEMTTDSFREVENE